MKVNYSQIKDMLNESELQEVYTYIDQNKESILRRLEEVNQVIDLIPIKAVLKDSQGFLHEEYHTFGFIKKDEGFVLVELIK